MKRAKCESMARDSLGAEKTELGGNGTWLPEQDSNLQPSG